MPLVNPIKESFGVVFSCLPLGKTVMGDLKKVATGWVGIPDGRGSREVAAAVSEQVAGHAANAAV